MTALFARLWAAPSLLLILSTLCWSGNFVLGRAVYDFFPPVALSFWRWFVAFLVVAVFAAPHLRRDAARLRQHWRLVLLLGFLGLASFNTLVYLGLNTTTVVNAVLLQSTMPVLIVLGSFLLLGEPVRLMQLLALAVSLCGVAAIVSQGSLQTLQALSLQPGDAWILLAVCFYALYSVLLRRRPAVHPLSLLAATFAVAWLMLLPLLLWEHHQVRQVDWSAQAVAVIAYVGLFPSLLAYFTFNRAVELIGANRAGVYVHLMPVFGSALAALFLDERLHGYHLAGAALIAAGIALTQLRRGP